MEKESLLKKMIKNFKPENSLESRDESGFSKADVIAYQYTRKLFESYKKTMSEKGYFFG